MYDDEPIEETDVEFEIAFYEGLIRKKPDFVDALKALGDLYTKKGLVEKGLQVDEHLSQLQPSDPVVLYNLACSYSLLNQTDKALRSIKRAIKCGYHDFDHIKEDKDLDNLRKDSRFSRYLLRVEKKVKEEIV